jgi:hypothetical protein
MYDALFRFNTQECLCAGWGIKFMLRLPSRQGKSLQDHLQYIFASDWLMHMEGGAKQLSQDDLIAVRQSAVFFKVSNSL